VSHAQEEPVRFHRRSRPTNPDSGLHPARGREGWLARLRRLAPGTGRPGLTVELQGQLALHLRRAARARDRSPQALARDLLAGGLEREALRRHAEGVLSSLTPREREIAWLAARGRTNQEIAAQLVISPETVKSHVRSVLTKFRLHSKSDLRMLLLDLGLRWWQQETD
jgi:DNA-binding CsgD family transcriptional regulator